MGVIYKARHLILNKFVAIKTLHTHLVSPSAIRRFQVEGKAESLLSHPNIVSFHDLGVTQSGQPYIIMEYIDGETLAEVLRREGQLPLPRFLKIFWQICDGLSLAHKKSILHRDIKPTNIMLVHDRGEDEVRIMDFGIAKMMDDTTAGAQQITKTGDMVGSPIYMSPEQARGLQTDQRSDLYSLGCVMYESLTGSPPFHGNTALDTVLMHLDSKPVPMKEASLGREVDPRIERVVNRWTS
jgi:serine/threonine-protein kinase